jgi:stearoyl-CoA desaturase (delta-9 desaturase)
MTELIYTLVATHITIVCVTLYLHRSQAHRAVMFHPAVEHFMRAWLWLTTGMVTRQWVAIHRKHHQCTDVEGDPHSPHLYGIWRVLFKGAALYHAASKDQELVDTLSLGTPTDWVEHNIYQPHSRLGIGILFLFNIALFGWIGALIWLVQMAWIPFWAAGVVNGVGHWWGYRNGNTRDESRNLLPWGIVIGGEELHNNHHLDATSARLSRKWWEFDIGWMYITALKRMGLAQIRSQGK